MTGGAVAGAGAVVGMAEPGCGGGVPASTGVAAALTAVAFSAGAVPLEPAGAAVEVAVGVPGR